MYSTVPSFNVRALGSQMNETFFSIFVHLDALGRGVLAPSYIPIAMSHACKLIEMKMDPSRYVNLIIYTSIKLKRDCLHSKLIVLTL